MPNRGTPVVLRRELNAQLAMIREVLDKHGIRGLRLEYQTFTQPACTRVVLNAEWGDSQGYVYTHRELKAARLPKMFIRRRFADNLTALYAGREIIRNP